MLDELLRLIKSEETLSMREIAERLQVSETLIGMMLADLERRNFLEAVEPCDHGSCMGCSLKTRCRLTPAVKVWRFKPAAKA